MAADNPKKYCGRISVEATVDELLGPNPVVGLSREKIAETAS